MTKHRHSIAKEATDNAAAIRVGKPEDELRTAIRELRELVVSVLHHLGDERAGARYGTLVFSREKRIPLEDAVKLVWGASAAKGAESRRNHAEILKLFATKGLNGAVLETELRRNKWVTSHEAVARFKSEAGLPQ